MRLSKGVWIGLLVTIVIIVALTTLDIRGFHMWEMPYIVFGCAIFLYAIFGWH